MSLFGAMSTAVSGLNAQSAAFTNISDNVSNSQTVGYKRVDTNFTDYLTESTPTLNESSSVLTTPDYVNTVQGTITQSQDPLAMAISGQGFFPVSEVTGTRGSNPQFSSTPYYTRTGDFTMNSQGYLVNSAGEYLNGWSVNPGTGAVSQGTVVPIQISQAPSQPTATSNVTLAANLPATPASGTATAASPLPSQVQVYDSLGNLHTLSMNWVQTAPDTWSVSLSSPDNVGGASLGSATVTFGSASGNPVSDGTIGSITGTGVTTSTYASGGPATVTLSANFGTGAQPITLNLGSYGQPSGLTQYAGSSFTLNGLTQDGVPPGNFTGVTTQSNGDVVVNYDNGQSVTVAQVPVVTFRAPDALQSQNGQAFTATQNSGIAVAQAANTDGAGNIVTSSTEASNVDIAIEFSQLIVAQQAYAANAKVVTSANQLLQTTINMQQ